jgi:hypothetical protein
MKTGGNLNEVGAVVCVSEALPLATGLRSEETSRRPRGLRKVIVQDLGRLYHLRR